ncbi:MAG: hypothetical protein U5K69_13580 [Balneolaceae bacterium]|nr:hypothetical protein [Balneolaceae bacterium]
MEKIIICILTVAFFGLTWGTSDVQGQDQENEETPYWYVSEYKIPFAKVDSLRTLNEMANPVYQKAIDEGYILDYKVFIHHTGGEYSVVLLTQYPSWDAIGEGRRFDEVDQIAIPDSVKRQKIIDGFNWVYEGAAHRDNIYTEVTDIE